MNIRGLHKNNPLLVGLAFFVTALALNFLARDYFAGLATGEGWDKVLDNPLFLFNRFSPTITACVFAYFLMGRDGLVDIKNRLFSFKGYWPWLIVAAFLPLDLSIMSLFTAMIVDGTAIDLSGLHFGLLGEMISDLMRQSFFGSGLGEEIGWRGFLLPVLLIRFNPIAATLILTALWSAWHIPGFGADADFMTRIWDYIILTTPYSFIMTYMYQKTDGNIMAPILLHGGINAFYGFAGGSMAVALGINGDFMGYVSYWVWAVGLLAAYLIYKDMREADEG